MGLTMAPMTAAVMASAPIGQSGEAAGVLTTMRQVGSVLGISVIGAVLQNQLVTNLREALVPITQIPAYLREKVLEELSTGRLGAGVSIPEIPGPLGAQLQILFKEEFARSLNTAMMVSVFICIAGAVVALFIRSHLKPKGTIAPQ